MDLSNQMIFCNNKYFSIKYFVENEISMPILFAIPCLAFHVVIKTKSANRNIIEETILYLKRNGTRKNEIASILCLDQRLVDIIIKNADKNGKQKNNGDFIIEDVITTNDFYIIYDLLTNQFVDGYIEADKFKDSCYEINYNDYNYKQNCYYFKESIASSYKHKIHFLYDKENAFDVNITPSEEDIINCYNSQTLYTDDSYINAEYLSENHQIWLTLAYLNIDSNTNYFSVINPFIDKLNQSNYFYNLIKKNLHNEYARQALDEYENNTKNNLIKKQNNRLRIKTSREEQSLKYLKKKYEKYGCFKDNFFISKFEEQLIKMQSEYDYIKTNKDLLKSGESIRLFWDFSYNVLEQLFTNLYKQYGRSLPEKLKNDHFFDKLGKEKQYRGQKEVINYYFEQITGNYDWKNISKFIYPDRISNAISKNNIGNDKQKKLNLIELFTANVINLYYNKNSIFGKIIDPEIDNFYWAMVVLYSNRKEVRHEINSTYNYIDESKNIDDVIKVIYEVVDRVLGVSEVIDIHNENIEENGYTEFIGSYKDLDDMPDLLQDTCNMLLRDIYNSSELYFSDCVIAFQNTSKIILEYIWKDINSLDDLDLYLRKIPDDSDDAKLLLMDKLYDIGIDIDLFNYTVDIQQAKKCMMNQYEFKKASTLIFFAPLFLSVVDNIAFMTLFEKLGKEYFIDAINSIDNRGHDKQSTDWGKINIINDKYINYCKILTSFYKEKL